MSIIIATLLAIWVYFDAEKRKNDVAAWTLGTLFLPFIIAPNYFAKRNLKKGEMRKGGTGWNFCRNFALYWTLVMVMFVISSFSTTAIIGFGGDPDLGMFGLSLLWAIPTGSSLIVGFFLRTPSHVEKGPTGALQKNKNRSTEQFSTT